MQSNSYDSSVSRQSRKRILIIVGTRPEVIKVAPVYLELVSRDCFEVMLCTTGQHTDLVKEVLTDFGLVPDVELKIMEHGQGLTDLTSRALAVASRAIQEFEPDAVLVHGDTTTTFASALSSFYLGVPVGHIEAGLRTGDLQSPFPEEFNRQAVSRVANWNFTPTATATANLLREGILESSIYQTGNTIVDAIKHVAQEFTDSRLGQLRLEAVNEIGFDPTQEKYVLVTTHRRENQNGGMADIFSAIRRLAIEFPASRFVLPLHPNPRIVQLAKVELSNQKNVVIINPLGYRKFLFLLSNSHFVITDSGGIQEEAVTLGVKVLVVRNQSERPEGLAEGTMTIVGTDRDEIVQAGQAAMKGKRQTGGINLVSNVYGDGNSAIRIANLLQEHLLNPQYRK